jgi:hypothetical protein
MAEEYKNAAAEAISPAVLKNREAGLLETAKALRALTIYPPKHPQRANAAAAAFAGVQAVLAGGGELSVQVGANGFYYHEQRLGENQALVRELAREMHVRQIKSFSLRSDLNLRDFVSFLELILEDPERFRQGKYIEQWIRDRQIETVWVNEIDFGRLLNVAPMADEAPEEEGAEEAAPVSLDAQLHELFDEIDAAEDGEQFAQLMRQSEAMARPLLESKQYDPVWRLVAVISLHASEDGRPGPAGESFRALAARTIRELSRGDFLARLLARLADPRENETESLNQVFLLLGPAIIDPIIDLVSRSEAIGPYRPLLQLALDLGPAARGPIEKRLRDDNSLAVRRALALLAEARWRESVEAVKPLLDHRDLRVRQEAARTLTRVRGIEATRALAGFLQREHDPETELAIVSAMGENKDVTAAPALVGLLRKRPLNESTAPLLQAVAESLGRIGSAEAVPELIRILNNWKILNRELGLGVRLKAAEALGRLGGESAMQALARYSRGGDSLSRTCAAVFEALVASNGKPVEPPEAQK